MNKKKKILLLLILAIIVISALFLANFTHTDRQNKNVSSVNPVKSRVSEYDFADKRGISSVVENSLSRSNILKNTKKTKQNIKESLVEKKEKVQLGGWTTENLNVRKKPSTNANILGTIPFNTYIRYYKYNDKYGEIVFEDEHAYVSLKYISDEECNFVIYNVPKNKGFKSYMSYKAITNKSSKQYKLQKIAITGEYGIRKVNGRFLVAIGTAFKADIGTYIDLILEDGFVIHCVVGDIKQDIHTESNNIVTKANGCVSEFIIDPKALNKTVKKTGNISDCNELWSEMVCTVIVYDKNVFEEGE